MNFDYFGYYRVNFYCVYQLGLPFNGLLNCTNKLRLKNTQYQPRSASTSASRLTQNAAQYA